MISKSEPLVGFIVLSWNGESLLRSCLESIGAQTFENIAVCLIDNGSTDETKNVFDAAGLKNKKYLKNPVNIGFARAVNQGVSRLLATSAEYIVLLNNDVVLDKNWTRNIVSGMESMRSIGAAQGANFTSDGEQYDSTGIYIEEGFIPRQKTSTEKLPYSLGPNAAAMMMRRDFVESMMYKNELLDGRFFAYVEDVDLLMRAFLGGWKHGFFPKAKATHVGSATGSRISKKKMFWGARNMIWFITKNIPLSIILKKMDKILVSHLANIEFLLRTDRRMVLPYLRGLIVGILFSPLFIRKRLHMLRTRKISDTELLGALTPSSPPLTHPFKYLLRKVVGR